MNLTEKIRVCEVGFRDGLQNEKTILSAADKAALIDRCSEAGFPVIEAGSFVSPKAVPQMADTDEVFRLIHKKEGTEYRALIANLRGVTRAAACGCTKVKMNVSASVAHNIANLNCTPAESVARFGECVAAAKESGIGISGSISMAFGSPWDKEIPVPVVREIVEAYLRADISEISLSDASGQANPAQVAKICREMKEAYPEVSWWLHFHNTRGLGLANVLAGMSEGFTQYDAALSGIGGCPFVPGAAGNISTEDLLHMCEEMGVATGIDLDAVLAAGRRMTELIGHTADSYVLRAGRASELIREVPVRRK